MYASFDTSESYCKEKRLEHIHTDFKETEFGSKDSLILK